jgi:drug/metabolite transporter (DMT)-like permease
MNRLVRLYPAAWRERYGDEMEALLEERPLGPFDLVDLFLGALDAHLHLRGPGQASEHEKGITMSLRTPGLAAIIGGSAYGLASLALVAGDQGTNQAATTIGFVMLIGAAVALLVALVGLSAFLARVHRRATWAAVAVPAAGAVMLVVGWLAAPIEPMYMVGFLGLILVIGGSVLFGLLTLVTTVLTRVGAAVLTAGAAINIGAWALILAQGGFQAGTDQAMEYGVLMIGSAGYAAGWIILGIDAVRRDRSPLATGRAAA